MTKQLRSKLVARAHRRSMRLWGNTINGLWAPVTNRLRSKGQWKSDYFHGMIRLA